MRDQRDALFSKFYLPSDMDFVSNNGLWFVSNRPLVPKEWELNEQVDFQKFVSLPVWVRIHKTFERWRKKMFVRIANFLGSPVCIDWEIKLGKRLDYACLSVVIDDKSQFSEEIKMRSEKGLVRNLKLTYD